MLYLNPEKSSIEGVFQVMMHQDKFRLFAKEVGPIFDVNKGSKVMGVSAQDGTKILARWHKQGRIARVGHGIYALIPMDTLAADFTLEDPWLLVPLLYMPGYIGGWTAAEYWDLTEQIFNSIMVFTTQPVYHKEAHFAQQSFRLKHIQEKRLFGLKIVWRHNEKMMISDIHRTIIDFFEEPEIAGGIQHAVDCLKNYLKKNEANLTIMSQYLETMNNGAIYKRLGFLLEKLLGSENPMVISLENKLTKGLAYLDPKQKEEVYLASKWNLFVPKNFNITE